MEYKKVIKVTPMTLDDYGKIYGVIVFNSGDGYLIEYSDGTSSWVSTAEYNGNVRNEELKDSFGFEEALLALKDYELLTRKSWEGHMFIVKLKDFELSKADMLRIEDFPDDAKQAFANTDFATWNLQNRVMSIHRNGYTMAWRPTLNDLFADDWQYFDAEKGFE